MIFWLIVRRRDVLPDVNGGVRRLNSSSYGPSDLTSSDRFSSHGCRKKHCPRNICPDCYVIKNGDSYSQLHATSTMLFGWFPMKLWRWYSCRWRLITLMAAYIHVTLGFKLKKMRTLVSNLQIFFCLISMSCFYDCFQKNIRLCHDRKKCLKILKICSFF